MKVLVCGGREFKDAEFVDNVLDGMHEENVITLIIHGGARGADSLGASWAEKRHVAKRMFRAEWSKYGKRAGLIRNCRMLDEGKPDKVVAFAGGRGTAHMVRYAKAKGVEVIEVG